MSGFYTYLYADPFTGEVFYVGKGKGGRAYFHLRSPKTHNGLLSQRIKQIRRAGGEPEVSIAPAASEDDAFRTEVTLIALIGRKDLGLGTLLNFTGGGEGPSGQVFSATSRAKMSASHKGYVPTEQARRNQSLAQTGRKASVEHRERISKALSGRERSPSHCAAISAAKKGIALSPAVTAAAAAVNTGRPKPLESVRRGAEKRRGVPLSAEHRKRVSEGVKAYLAAQRAAGVLK